MAQNLTFADVFISYSRRDAEFVRKLNDALADKGYETWVDWNDIPLTADWWSEIQTGIESANTFIFVISPDSVQSEVCFREIEYAVSNHKRFVPILYRELDESLLKTQAHSVINSHNWILFNKGDDLFDTTVGQLIEVLNTDLQYVRDHTRYLVQSHQWNDNKRDSSFLLSGVRLQSAERWLANSVGKEPKPTQIQTDYIIASQQNRLSRQRRAIFGISLALVVAVGLAIFSLFMFQRAESQRMVADENLATAVAAESTSEANKIAAEVQAAFANLQTTRVEQNLATAVAAEATSQANKIAAEVQAAFANLQTTKVAEEAERAQSIALAAQSYFEMDGDFPERSVNLAVYALENLEYTWEAERALIRSIIGSQQIPAYDGHNAPVFSIVWSPQDDYVLSISEDNQIQIWQSDTRDQVASLPNINGGFVTATWSPDESMIATGTIEGTLYILDAETGEELKTFHEHERRINLVTWSPDGSELLTISADGTARIWDVDSWEVAHVLAGHAGDVTDAGWSFDGSKVATAGNDSTVRIWDVETGEMLHTLQGHIGKVEAVAWSPVGHQLVSAGIDNRIILWDGATGEVVQELLGHTEAVRTVSWSPNGEYIASGGTDDTVRIWHVVSGRQPLILSDDQGDIYKVAWSKDGSYLASAGADGEVHLWKTWMNTDELIQSAEECCITRPMTDEELAQFGLPPVATPEAPSDLSSCPNILPSLLYPGVRAIVTDEDDRSLRMREGAGLDYRIRALLLPGQTFQIVEGPVCQDEYAWFRILFGVNATTGWIAESGDGYYFALPIGFEQPQ